MNNTTKVIQEYNLEEVVNSLTEEVVTQRHYELTAERERLEKLDTKWIEIASQTYRFQTLAKKYKEMAAKYLDQLKKLSEGNSRSLGGYWFEKSYRKGSIDYAFIPELMDVDLDQYRKDDVEIWKLNKIEKD